MRTKVSDFMREMKLKKLTPIDIQLMVNSWALSVSSPLYCQRYKPSEHWESYELGVWIELYRSEGWVRKSYRLKYPVSTDVEWGNMSTDSIVDLLQYAEDTWSKLRYVLQHNA